MHRLYAQGGAAVAPIGAVFPGAIVDGAVSRAFLKSMIADDAEVLPQIEAIVHPLVAQDRQHFVATHDDAILVFDIPLLFETGAEAWLDGIAVVTALPDVQKQRVLDRPGMTTAQFEAILAKQLPDAQKRARADFVIETLTLDGARKAVQNVIDQLRADHA